MSTCQLQSPYRVIFHDDATVRFYNVYQQVWQTMPARLVEDRILDTLNQADRDRIVKIGKAQYAGH